MTKLIEDKIYSSLQVVRKIDELHANENDSQLSNMLVLAAGVTLASFTISPLIFFIVPCVYFSSKLNAYNYKIISDDEASQDDTYSGKEEMLTIKKLLAHGYNKDAIENQGPYELVNYEDFSLIEPQQNELVLEPTLASVSE